jgi:fluoride exporter
MTGAGLHALAVGVGAAAGALLRWGVSLLLNPLWLGFPLGTLAINCLGGLGIGAAIVVFERVQAEPLRLLMVPGFLGGFTTFSAFSGESLALLQRGHFGLAAVHTTAHVLGALACAAAGFALTRMLWR